MEAVVVVAAAIRRATREIATTMARVVGETVTVEGETGTVEGVMAMVPVEAMVGEEGMGMGEVEGEEALEGRTQTTMSVSLVLGTRVQGEVLWMVLMMKTGDKGSKMSQSVLIT